MKRYLIIGITPFEKPDLSLMSGLQNAGAYPVLNLGHNKSVAEQSLEKLAQSSISDFGVCFPNSDFIDIKLPDKVSTIFINYGIKVKRKGNIKIIYQVFDLESAKLARAEGADGLIVKGNESAGMVGDESSFVLFQRIIQEITDIQVWVQGGVGIHTAAA